MPPKFEKCQAIGFSSFAMAVVGTGGACMRACSAKLFSIKIYHYEKEMAVIKLKLHGSLKLCSLTHVKSAT